MKLLKEKENVKNELCFKVRRGLGIIKFSCCDFAVLCIKAFKWRGERAAALYIQINVFCCFVNLSYFLFCCCGNIFFSVCFSIYPSSHHFVFIAASLLRINSTSVFDDNKPALNPPLHLLSSLLLLIFPRCGSDINNFGIKNYRGELANI